MEATRAWVIGLGLLAAVGCSKDSEDAPSEQTEAPGAKAAQAAEPAAEQPKTGAEDGRDWAQQYAETMCAKVEDCAKKALERLPEAVRTAAESAMPTKEQCLAQGAKANADKAGAMELSDEELAVFQGCMAVLRDADCDGMQKVMEGEDCRRVTEMFGAKDPAAAGQ